MTREESVQALNFLQSHYILKAKERKMARKKLEKPLYIRLQSGRGKDFHVRVIQEERLISTIPELDTEFDKDMRDIGSSEDLPESDRIMVCQQKGVRQENCPAE